MANPDGHPATLLPGTARPPTPNLRHGLFQQARELTDEQRELADELHAALPWAVESDWPACAPR